MKCFIVALLFSVMTCNGQEPDTLIYIDTEDHEQVIVDMQNTIDSLETLIELLQSAIESSHQDIIADTFQVSLQDNQIYVEVKKEGHNVWFRLVDGPKRMNAQYYDYERKIYLMDSTHSVGTLYIK